MLEGFKGEPEEDDGVEEAVQTMGPEDLQKRDKRDGRRGGAGGGGVAGARFGAPAPGAEGSQTLRRSFWEDELLPQLQVGATTSCRQRQRRQKS